MQTLRLAGLVLVALCTQARGQWYDDFDSYSPGSLVAQSLWEGFNGGGGDAVVTSSERFTLDHSIELDPRADPVYDFANIPGGRPTSGSWLFSGKTYLPSTAGGRGVLGMYNKYPAGFNRSVVIEFDTNTGNVLNKGGGETLPLILDEWVTLSVCIDLEADCVDIFYGDDLLSQGRSWRFGADGPGPLEISSINVCGCGVTQMFWDDFRLELIHGPCARLHAAPNPTVAGDTLTLELDAPASTGGDRGALFFWAVNGITFRSRLLNLQLDGAGHWERSFTVPAGLAGLEVGLKAIVLSNAGDITLSNEELILFQ